MDIEKLREKFRPEKVRVLLIGESPPAEGTFFYDRSLMTAYTKSAFESALSQKFSTNAEFFEYMRQTGYYLEDLSQVPVDKLPCAEREAKLIEESQRFAERVSQMNPKAVVIVLKKIEKIVRQALRKAGSSAEVYVLPFPGNGHQTKYQAQLISIVHAHRIRA
ncbi:hypothetical protein DU002_12720 [Corallincola holothuriorum]|uniref:Uracil-DNA glycosylase-like domain-containing protein n=1 Tax=Corallincola holothuriorum TaxID=2282215 RepID=A0A368NEY2_9GAMM|nr:hypothetical protein [Corallincola holothuriorum]RCU49207.1 hypothetical protein DU002_12720 [Corallincola holothuriorum]